MAADDLGPSIVIVPAQRSAERLTRRMRAAGRQVVLHPESWAEAAAGGVTVIGTRSAIWAPLPEVASIVVLDSHDEALQSERSPTWSAVGLAVERAQRERVPCVLVSPTPRHEHSLGRPVHTVSRDDERAGWAPLHIVDLRHTDPRHGLFTPALVDLLRSDKRVIAVINRKGRSNLLVCRSCDEVARCERCDSATNLASELLTCHRCKTDQPVICRHCGSTGFKQLRPGVTRIREDLESLALRPVGEVTSDSDALPDADVLVGTEAVLHRVGKADAIVFLDFDQELLAPRNRAAEDALVLLARASRLVGGRRSNGIVMTQTRQPDHETLGAALHADPSRLDAVESVRRQELRWPPYRVLAAISGPAAEQYVDGLRGAIDVLGPSNGVWLVSARDHDELSEVLARANRPAGRLRVEVDPPRA